MITHPSTTQARRCLTTEIGRDPVFSSQYGRSQWVYFFEYISLEYKFITQKKKTTAPGLPKWSPTLVLPRPEDV